MTNQLATIKEYGPPYWKERAWNLDGFEDWERELLTAVKVHSVMAVEDELNNLEHSDGEWYKPYGKTRAFAFDYHTDIMTASSQQLRQWRQERAARFVRFNPDVTQEMIAELARLEEEPHDHHL